MTRAALLNGLCLIIALAVMLSALHDVGPAQVVDSLASAGVSDQIGHGHSHDDVDLDPEHRPGHSLEHKDHSHVTLGLTALPVSLIAPDGKFLRLWEQGRPPSHLSFRLDRPPCPLSVA
jgi:hypothetical protein